MSGFAAKKGVFPTRSDIALQSVDGLGFRPIAVIAWWSRQSSHDGIERGNQGGIGFWARDTSAAVAWSSRDGTPSSETGSLADHGAILGLAGAHDVLSMRGDLVSFDASGFTLRWSTRPAERWLVHFLALGGTPSIGARVGIVTSPPSNTSTDLELPAMPADLLLLVPTTAEPGVQAKGLGIGIGAASERHQAAAGYSSPNGAPPGSVAGMQRGGSAVIVPSSLGSPSTIGSVRRRRGHDPAIEWSGPGPRPGLCYLALQGLRAKVGTEISTATPGQRRTRVGFRPEALLVFSWGLPASVQPKGIGRLCLGGASERESGCAGWDVRNIDAQETSTHVVSSTSDALVITDTQTGGVHARAALDSIDDSGFTLDWTESDGKLRQFAYIAMSEQKAENRVSRLLGRRIRRR